MLAFNLWAEGIPDENGPDSYPKSKGVLAATIYTVRGRLSLKRRRWWTASSEAVKLQRDGAVNNCFL